jgi:hypothetical protein
MMPPFRPIQATPSKSGIVFLVIRHCDSKAGEPKSSSSGNCVGSGLGWKQKAAYLERCGDFHGHVSGQMGITGSGITQTASLAGITAGNVISVSTNGQEGLNYARDAVISQPVVAMASLLLNAE